MANLAQAMSDGVFRVVGDLESPCIVFGVCLKYFRYLRGYGGTLWVIKLFLQTSIFI